MSCAQHLDFSAETDWVSVGIIGAGVVGKAMDAALKQAGFNTLIYDINHDKMKHSLREVVIGSHLIFVCVPTPNKRNSAIDLSYVEKALSDINDIAEVFTNYNPVILIKSTVTPSTTETLQAKYPKLRLGYCPEFLRQEYAEFDACNPSRIVVGMCNPEDEKDVKPIIEKLSCPHIFFTSPVTAELIKQLSNAFLSVKVAYANVISILSERYGAKAIDVYSGITFDQRISGSHLNPLMGKMSADSPCLPKDLNALINCADGDVADFLELVYWLAVEKSL